MIKSITLQHRSVKIIPILALNKIHSNVEISSQNTIIHRTFITWIIVFFLLKI